MDLWEQYATLRAEGLQRDEGTGAATEFYRAHCEEMDAGALVAWPEQFDDDELSAVQHVMNLRFKNRVAFMAEYQNDPQPLVAGINDLDAKDIAEKTNGLQRLCVPASATRLTAFADCGSEILFWCVVAWDDAFSGSVIDYGTFPHQPRPYFAATDAKPGLSELSVGGKRLGDLNEDARVYAGLRETVAHVLGRTYPRVGGGTEIVSRCLVDSGDWSKTVAQFCHASPYRTALTPSKGWGIGSGAPMANWPVQPGERLVSGKPGTHWRDRVNKEGGRLITFDANYWKSFVARALQAAPRSAGCLMLFGQRPDEHRLFADHLTAEYQAAEVTSRVGDQRPQTVWRLRPGRTDNHFFDALVGCAVAASLSGVQWDSGVAAGEQPRAKQERKKLTLSELYNTKHGRGR